MLELVIGWMPPAEVCRFGCATSTLKRLAHAEHVWQNLLQRAFPDMLNMMTHDSPMECFRVLAFHRIGLNCPCVPGCCGSLSRNGSRRCPCVAARTEQLPLRLGSLSQTRSGSSALAGGGFTVMLATLRRHFTFEHKDIEALQDDTLASLDMLVLCTTAGRALDALELAALRAWVERGGALIVSAFANWSAFGHYAEKTVGWLGVETIPRTAFGGLVTHRIPLDPIKPNNDATSMLLKGPFGQPEHFVNLGESEFTVSANAVSYGAVKLSPTLLFYPPKSVANGGVTGKGRVLICSNYHWLADPQHWDGGLFAYRHRGVEQFQPHQALRPNQALLLNFIAGAIAARADR